MNIIITFSFIVFDVVTGIINAWKNKELKSSKMREGLFNKAGLLLVIVLGVGIDYAQKYMELGFSVPIAKAICGFIILMEIISIFENICSISPVLKNSKIAQYFLLKEDE